MYFFASMNSGEPPDYGPITAQKNSDGYIQLCCIFAMNDGFEKTNQGFDRLVLPDDTCQDEEIAVTSIYVENKVVEFFCQNVTLAFCVI